MGHGAQSRENADGGGGGGGGGVPLSFPPIPCPLPTPTTLSHFRTSQHVHARTNIPNCVLSQKVPN